MHQPQPNQPRINWSTSGGAAVVSVVTDLVDLYRKGELKEELRPTTLIDLGGAYARFYKAAFRRQDRVAWSIERYPNGFDDLVREVNERLAREGIQVLNSIKSPALYRRIPQDARKVIENCSELVAQGILSREEALLIVKRDFNLELTAAQVSYHFGASATRGSTEAATSEDTRKRAVVFAIERIKNSLSLELSLDRFLKGNLFEAYVGVFLALHYEELAVKRQVQLPIAYRDFDGNPHSHVFLDFLVGGEIFEAKFRNSYENICRSALTQLCAYERRTGAPAHVTVVYRHPCPLMRLAIDSNINLDAEAQSLGLVELGALNRRIAQSLRYVSIEELIAQEEKHAPLLRRLLNVVDCDTEQGNSHTLKQLTTWLDRIGRSGEQIPTKIDLLLNRLADGRGFSAAEEQRLLGEPQPQSEEERGSDALRMKIIERTLSAAREGLLRELYSVLTGKEIARIGGEELSFIEQIIAKTPSRFEDAVLTLLAAKESSATERLSKRRSAAEEQAHQGKALISAFSTVQDRVRADLAAEARQAHAELMQAAGPVIEQARKLYPKREFMVSNGEFAAHEARMLAAFGRQSGSKSMASKPPLPTRSPTHLLGASGSSVSNFLAPIQMPQSNSKVETIRSLGMRIDQEVAGMMRIFKEGLPSRVEKVTREYTLQKGSGELLSQFGMDLASRSAQIERGFTELAATAEQSPEVREYLQFRLDPLSKSSKREQHFAEEIQRHFSLAAPRCLAASLTVIGQHMDSRVRAGAELDAYEVLAELYTLFRSPTYASLGFTVLPLVVVQMLKNCAATQLISIRAEECNGGVLEGYRNGSSSREISLGILGAEIAAVRQFYRETELLTENTRGKVTFRMPTRAPMITAAQELNSANSTVRDREQFAEHLGSLRGSIRHLRKALIRAHENVHSPLFCGVLPQALKQARSAAPRDEVSVPSPGIIHLNEDPQLLLARNADCAASLFIRLGLLPQHLYLDLLSRREAQSRVLAFHDYRLALEFLAAHPLSCEVHGVSDETLIATALEAAERSDEMYARLLG